MEQFAASTHPGLRRSHNEDCYGADPELGLWLVADGVGGHSFGEVASALVKATVVNAFSQGVQLVEAIHRAHEAVLNEIRLREENLGMGSTVVAATVQEGRYEIAWVGDSRAYLWNGESLKQLTRDHSHVCDLVDRGVLAAHETRSHPERHVLTQSVGVFENMELNPGTLTGTLAKGEQLLLCSDGLTDELTDQAIASNLARHPTTQTQVDGLMNAALTAGGRDNITLILLGRTAVESSRAIGEYDMDVTQNIDRSTLPAPPVPAPGKQGFTRWVLVAVTLGFVLAIAMYLAI